MDLFTLLPKSARAVLGSKSSILASSLESSEAYLNVEVEEDSEDDCDLRGEREALSFLASSSSSIA